MIEVRPFGDSALQVTLGDVVHPETLPRVHALMRRVEADRAAGGPWGAPVPGITTLLVPFDAHASADEAATDRLRRFADAVAADAVAADTTQTQVTTHRIPVRYGGADGPDLDAVAARLGLTPERVVELHTSVCYTVYILGFMPGFGYLGELPEGLWLPRRDTPRTLVPAGSVAIAGRQTAVYPASTPGGWHLLGHTEVRPWDIERDSPSMLRPGDIVRFEPVG